MLQRLTFFMAVLALRTAQPDYFRISWKARGLAEWPERSPAPKSGRVGAGDVVCVCIQQGDREGSSGLFET